MTVDRRPPQCLLLICYFVPAGWFVCSESVIDMRDKRSFSNLNFLPIVEEEMTGFPVTSCIKRYAPNISNGYYGFQPVAQHKDERQQQQHEQMEVTVTEDEACGQQTLNNSNSCRKRTWDCSDIDVILKKRRENG